MRRPRRQKQKLTDLIPPMRLWRKEGIDPPREGESHESFRERVAKWLHAEKWRDLLHPAQELYQPEDGPWLENAYAKLQGGVFQKLHLDRLPPSSMVCYDDKFDLFGLPWRNDAERELAFQGVRDHAAARAKIAPLQAVITVLECKALLVDEDGRPGGEDWIICVFLERPAGLYVQIATPIGENWTVEKFTRSTLEEANWPGLFPKDTGS